MKKPFLLVSLLCLWACAFAQSKEMCCKYLKNTTANLIPISVRAAGFLENSEDDSCITLLVDSVTNCVLRLGTPSAWAAWDSVASNGLGMQEVMESAVLLFQTRTADFGAQLLSSANKGNTAFESMFEMVLEAEIEEYENNMPARCCAFVRGAKGIRPDVRHVLLKKIEAAWAANQNE